MLAATYMRTTAVRDRRAARDAGRRRTQTAANNGMHTNPVTEHTKSITDLILVSVSLSSCLSV
jgi:hypothetical protein